MFYFFIGKVWVHGERQHGAGQPFGSGTQCQPIQACKGRLLAHGAWVVDHGGDAGCRSIRKEEKTVERIKASTTARAPSEKKLFFILLISFILQGNFFNNNFSLYLTFYTLLEKKTTI